MTSSSIVRHSANKQKLAAQPTKKASTPPPASLSTSDSSAVSSSSVASIELDSSANSSFAGIEPKAEVELLVPRIVCEEEREEDMVANLRVNFKER